MIVEYDEPLLRGEERTQTAKAAAALACRPEPECEDLGEHAKVPGANAEPVHPPPEAIGEVVGERRREHRLATAAGSDEREACRSRGLDERTERRELRVAAFESTRWRGKQRERRLHHADETRLVPRPIDFDGLRYGK